MGGTQTGRGVGLVTIGQAPREDIEAVLRPALGDRHIVQAGALDRLDTAQIATLAPADDDVPLVTRLRDGTQVVVGKRAVLPHLAEAVADVGADGRPVAVLCSGSFPRLESVVGVILPEAALRTRLVRELGVSDRLGVVAPLREQADQADVKWGDLATELVAVFASPYGPDSAVREAAARLRDQGPGLVLLDCMGFVERHRALVADVVGVPVLSAASVLADALAGAPGGEVVR